MGRDALNRDLPTLKGIDFNVQSCNEACSSYQYFGLQNSAECWCGNSYGKHGAAANEEECLPCNSDTDVMCGGGFRNSLYKVVALDTPTSTEATTLSTTMTTTATTTSTQAFEKLRSSVESCTSATIIKDARICK